MTFEELVETLVETHRTYQQQAIEEKFTKTRQLKQGMMHELLTGRIRLV
jgi:hypothetical protein